MNESNAFEECTILQMSDGHNNQKQDKKFKLVKCIKNVIRIVNEGIFAFGVLERCLWEVFSKSCTMILVITSSFIDIAIGGLHTILYVFWQYYPKRVLLPFLNCFFPFFS